MREGENQKWEPKGMLSHLADNAKHSVEGDKPLTNESSQGYFTEPVTVFDKNNKSLILPARLLNAIDAAMHEYTKNAYPNHHLIPTDLSFLKALAKTIKLNKYHYNEDSQDWVSSTTGEPIFTNPNNQALKNMLDLLSFESDELTFFARLKSAARAARKETAPLDPNRAPQKKTAAGE